jgi:hypothetical protein
MHRTQKPALHARTLTLTDEAVRQLDRLASDLGALSGRRVSLSGAVRALAASAEREGYVWTVTKLLPIVENQQRKTVWGKLPAQRSR